jgi:hypothetical protein
MLPWSAGVPLSFGQSDMPDTWRPDRAIQVRIAAATCDAFSVLFTDAAEAIVARRLGEASPLPVDYPTIDDGLETMVFIEAALASARAGGWVELNAYR